MSAGKGDSPRPVNGDKYRSGYDRIFRKKTPVCKKCNGTGWYQYDDIHSTICNKCCQHDQGWWELEKEFHGKSYIDGADNFCCRNGCGTMRRDISLMK